MFFIAFPKLTLSLAQTEQSMKSIAMLTTGLFILFAACQFKNNEPMSLDDYPVYEGHDLGLQYSPKKSSFKIWSPPADEVTLRLYAQGEGGEAFEEYEMNPDFQGTWSYTVEKDLKWAYYTFQVKIGETLLNEVPDPYARAVGVNGRRAQIIDFEETNPNGWMQDRRPPLKNFTDIIIYELHFRDLSTHSNSGIRHKGKFLGLTETGTKSPQGEATGLDHIKDFGVTHVHILPSYDFLSIDETKLEEGKFNWGYDPQNYNVPEGSYATDPANGAVRVREFKQMVKALHDKGIRVVLDVVYNHTGATETSLFNQLVPGYYYRQDALGGFSNASACGNETASDRPMFRKFMIESVKYWAEEYHIDGFRFDLMGIHDIETMNQISAALRQIDPTIFVYGEGWTAGDSPLPYEERALKRFTHRMNGVAAFSDNMRDGVKGHVFTHDAKGFASGHPDLKETVKFGIVASTQHPQIDYKKVQWLDVPEPWAREPSQTINYVSCHDNHTLWDRLTLSVPEATEAEKIQMHKLAGAIVLTSQGVSFLHAGVEMLRTKNGVENSFESPDEINQIDWSRKAKYKDVYNYYKGLIQLRKNHPAFRMTTNDLLQKHLRFLDTESEHLIAYTLSDHANGDAWREILVALNGNTKPEQAAIPAGEWTIALDGKEVKESGLGLLGKGRLTVPANSAMVLYRE